jgi:hypothetical protein
MSNHDVLEMEFEQNLKDDVNGRFLQELQKSLFEYAFAIERHISTGLSSEEFARWKNLQAAVETASVVSGNLHNNFQDT